MADRKPSGTMNVDTKLVRDLAEMLAESGLTEIEVEDGNRRVRVARQTGGGAASVAAAPPPMPVQTAPAPATP
ncbi:MAG: acetyl-CoA carboxylase, biotin carboxyl carrier protein, partial [Pacificimonas sp.]